MARFPKSESEIFALAQEMVTGLNANAAVYPSPPVSVADLGSALSAFVTAKNASTAAQAAAEQTTATKDEALQTLVDDMKADLRYAENTVDFDDDKLKLIGWGGRKAKTSLEAPGQARTLEAPRQGEGWIFLDWKARGPMSDWLSKAKSPYRTRNAARNGNTASSPSTKRAKVNPATPSWRCCESKERSRLKC